MSSFGTKCVLISLVITSPSKSHSEASYLISKTGTFLEILLLPPNLIPLLSENILDAILKSEIY